MNGPIQHFQLFNGQTLVYTDVSQSPVCQSSNAARHHVTFVLLYHKLKELKTNMTPVNKHQTINSRDYR